VITGGATIAPMAAPLCTSPCTNARSFAGYHSLTALKAAMKLPGSPSPSRNRRPPSDQGPRANAWSMFAADHQTMNPASDRRVPKRSTRKPEPTYITV
jgi:hypothetical protein